MAKAKSPKDTNNHSSHQSDSEETRSFDLRMGKTVILSVVGELESFDYYDGAGEAAYREWYEAAKAWADRVYPNSPDNLRIASRYFVKYDAPFVKIMLILLIDAEPTGRDVAALYTESDDYKDILKYLQQEYNLLIRSNEHYLYSGGYFIKP